MIMILSNMVISVKKLNLKKVKSLLIIKIHIQFRRQIPVATKLPCTIQTLKLKMRDQ